MMRDIIDIFNLEGVELVRLSGLFVRARRISNMQELMPEDVDKIVHKLKKNKIIKYEYILYCPQCKDVLYIVKYKTDNPYSAFVCHTCNAIFVPEKEISLFEFDDEDQLYE